jgi:hypothetical protein
MLLQLERSFPERHDSVPLRGLSLSVFRAGKGADKSVVLRGAEAMIRSNPPGQLEVACYAT